MNKQTKKENRTNNLRNDKSSIVALLLTAGGVAVWEIGTGRIETRKLMIETKITLTKSSPNKLQRLLAAGF